MGFLSSRLLSDTTCLLSLVHPSIHPSIQHLFHSFITACRTHQDLSKGYSRSLPWRHYCRARRVSNFMFAVTWTATALFLNPLYFTLLYFTLLYFIVTTTNSFLSRSDSQHKPQPPLPPNTLITPSWPPVFPSPTCTK